MFPSGGAFEARQHAAVVLAYLGEPQHAPLAHPLPEGPGLRGAAELEHRDPTRGEVPFVEPESRRTQIPFSALISACFDDMNLSINTMLHFGSVPIVVVGESVKSSPR